MKYQCEKSDTKAIEPIEFTNELKKSNTVTCRLPKDFEHRDSYGNKSQLRPGDVQWMTADAGLIHSEMLEQEFARPGGRLHGIQCGLICLERIK